MSEPFDKVDAVSSASLPNGNTIVIANDIKEMTGGDMFQLITDKVYPADYDATTDLAKKEQNSNERPTLKSQPENLADYDIVFLGYPNWWGTLPMALFTFLENNDLSGKTIIPFCTHEGSGLGDSQRDIAKLCPESKIIDGLAVRGGSVTSAKTDVEKWLQKIGLYQQ
ncbi:MAG: flavodoxin [Planctomycetia bacterium]|nr:flavodoxin [Planctomycetia bacterium]